MVNGEPPLDDGVLLVSGGYDTVIKVWSAYSGTCSARSLVHGESQVNCLQITPDRAYFVAGGYQSVRLYDVNTNNNNPIVSYDGLSKNVTSIGCHEDFNFMFTTGEDTCAKIWDARCGGTQCQRMFEAKGPLNAGVLHPNQTTLFLCDQNGSMYMWDLRHNFNEMMELSKDCSIQHVDIDKQAGNAIAVDNKGFLYFMRLDEPSLENTPFFNECSTALKIRAHPRYGLKCRFSPDSEMIVTSSADKTAKVWMVSELEKALEEAVAERTAQGNEMEFKTVDLQPQRTLTKEGQRWVWDLAFTMDSENVFTASSDNMVRLWNLNTGEMAREYSGHSKAVVALSFMDRPSE